MNAGENCGIIKRKVGIGEGYENYFIHRRRENHLTEENKMEWIPLDELPNRILQYCERNGLTREEFGARVGASRQSVNDWVSKRFYPKITVYEKILYLLQESDNT